MSTDRPRKAAKPAPPSKLDERAIEAAADVICRRFHCRLQSNRTPQYHDRETAAEAIRAYCREMGRGGVDVD